MRIEDIYKNIAKSNYDIKKAIRQARKTKPSKDARKITLGDFLSLSDEQLERMTHGDKR